MPEVIGQAKNAPMSNFNLKNNEMLSAAEITSTMRPRAYLPGGNAFLGVFLLKTGEMEEDLIKGERVCRAMTVGLFR